MRKPPPSPILWGLLTPLQKRAPIAASTALPFLGFQDGWVDAFYQKSYLARMSRPTLAQDFESTDIAPCEKRPSLKKKHIVFHSHLSSFWSVHIVQPASWGRSFRKKKRRGQVENGDLTLIRCPDRSICESERLSQIQMILKSKCEHKNNDVDMTICKCSGIFPFLPIMLFLGALGELLFYISLSLGFGKYWSIQKVKYQ